MSECKLDCVSRAPESDYLAMSHDGHVIRDNQPSKIRTTFKKAPPVLYMYMPVSRY